MWMGRMRSLSFRMMRCVMWLLLLASDRRAGTVLIILGALQFGMNQKESARQKEDLRVLLEHFDAGQMDRYEAYRRSGLTKGNVRKVSSTSLKKYGSCSLTTAVPASSSIRSSNNPSPLRSSPSFVVSPRSSSARSSRKVRLPELRSPTLP
jgi:hypothetical protein